MNSLTKFELSPEILKDFFVWINLEKEFKPMTVYSLKTHTNNLTKQIHNKPFTLETCREYLLSMKETGKKASYRAIITEAVFTSRWALVEGYWNLGKRIRTDSVAQEHAKGNKTFVQDLARNLNIADRTIYYALQAYDKYPKTDLIPEELLRMGVPLPLVSELLGHQNYETTRRYTHLVLDDLRSASTFHPLNQANLPSEDIIIALKRDLNKYYKINRDDIQMEIKEGKNIFELKLKW